MDHEKGISDLTMAEPCVSFVYGQVEDTLSAPRPWQLPIPATHQLRNPSRQAATTADHWGEAAKSCGSLGRVYFLSRLEAKASACGDASLLSHDGPPNLVLTTTTEYTMEYEVPP